MRFDIVTIFPQFFEGFLSHGIVRRARQRSQVQVSVHDLRDFTYDRHHVVDDRPFGGSDGMVLKPEPIFRAVEALTHPFQYTPLGEDRQAAEQAPVSVIVLTPQGKPFTQAEAARLSQKEQIVLICGRYEGIDERVAQNVATDELSIGDYVLSGGEVAAMVVSDAIIRLLPETLGSATSAVNESFSAGRLDYPVYTRPACYRGLEVPKELMTGHHAEIDLWRRRKALEKTKAYRPDLLRDTAALDALDQKILKTIEAEAEDRH
ncbi:MAG: tRNA (guanosine(37)-N1)-methyltransferase TrmD [Blastocatellia bacterium]|nr:tRNA (guanosine(37)-N1)-methyltransferase TrmD [Blastocatellia bacterium]